MLKKQQQQQRKEPYPIGTHLKVKRSGGLYEHHGIYKGKGKVIHYWPKGSLFQKGGLNVRIQEGTMRDFIGESTKNDVRVVDHPTTKRSGTEIAREAEKSIGTGGYDLISNNCEHFANRMVTGDEIGTSQQVERAKTSLINGTIRLLESQQENRQYSIDDSQQIDPSSYYKRNLDNPSISGDEQKGENIGNTIGDDIFKYGVIPAVTVGTSYYAPEALPVLPLVEPILDKTVGAGLRKIGGLVGSLFEESKGTKSADTPVAIEDQPSVVEVET